MTNPCAGSRLCLSRRRWVAATLGGGLASAFGLPLRAAVAAKGELVGWPEITLLDGSRLPASHWKDRPAVIVFWSTDCAYCKRHNAHLDKLFRRTRANGGELRILALATDSDPQQVRRYMQENGYGFPVALDSGGLRARLSERKVVPMTVLIDRAGRLLQAIPGQMSEDDMLGLGQ